MTYKVRLVNFGYDLNQGNPFPSIDDAFEACQKAGFDSLIIDEKGNGVASWSIIGGRKMILRWHEDLNTPDGEYINMN